MSGTFWTCWEWLPLLLGPVIGLVIVSAAVALCVRAILWLASWLFRRVD
jgi:hypothetical protein